MVKRPNNQNPFIFGRYCAQSYGDADVRAAFDELSRIKKKKRYDPILIKTQEIKTFVTKIRRNEFNSQRNRLLLAMISVGHKYVCAFEGCTTTENLNIDHIEPLSLGGSDEIKNLQFLCRKHNRAKGAKK